MPRRANVLASASSTFELLKPEPRRRTCSAASRFAPARERLKRQTSPADASTPISLAHDARSPRASLTRSAFAPAEASLRSLLTAKTRQGLAATSAGSDESVSERASSSPPGERATLVASARPTNSHIRRRRSAAVRDENMGNLHG